MTVHFRQRNASNFGTDLQRHSFVRYPGARGIDQAKFDFLLNYEERKTGRDALLRVFAKEEENIGYTFSDRKASNEKFERTLLIGVVGAETLQAISSANFAVEVGVQQRSPEKVPATSEPRTGAEGFCKRNNIERRRGFGSA